MKIITRSISRKTRGDGDTLDITGDLEALLTASGLGEGMAHLFIGGSTAGLTTLEFESGVIEDLAEVFETLAPADRDWRHHQRWGDHNGHSHIRSALLGPNLAVPFVKGQLTLGTWQQVVLIDFDETPLQADEKLDLVAFDMLCGPMQGATTNLMP
jgi:secondary thiamine-phosphate synthase enzyme